MLKTKFNFGYFSFIAALCAVDVSAEDNTLEEVETKVGGFIRADYGYGDRYPVSQGEDRLGVSKAALAVNTNYDGVKGVLVFGTEITTEEDATTDGDVDVKDAFIVLENIGNSGINFSVGAQPLLFGLKPNGYPGDRSLQGSLEYGAQGLFAVSMQAGPSVIFNADLINGVNLRAGVFDRNSYDPDIEIEDGASLIDSGFVQISLTDLFGTGIYGVVGGESLFLDLENDAEGIVTLGLGWTNDWFDFSTEVVGLQDTIIENQLENSRGLTLDLEEDEIYTIVEASIKPTKSTQLYADYSSARELELDTTRVGLHYNMNKHTLLTAEFSRDGFGEGEIQDEDITSVDFRIELSY